MPFDDYEIGADGWVQTEITSVVNPADKQSDRPSLLTRFRGGQPDPSVVPVIKNYDVADLGVVSPLPAGSSGITDLRSVNDVLPAGFNPHLIWAFDHK